MQLVFNNDQTKFVATTYYNSLFVDISSGYEHDIDDHEEVSCISNIVYADN